MSPIVFKAPMQAPINPNNVARTKIKKEFKLGGIIVGVLALIVVINMYVIEPFYVQGISMQPTLHTGNILFVWKFPQTWAKITNSQYLPNRSNLVVVQKTEVSGEQLVKRVIGLPGDRVVIANGVITIYNSDHPKGFNPDSAPYGKRLVPIDGSYATQVAAGQAFVLGDNREIGASIDSRSSLGNVTSDIIIGQVIFRVFPPTQIRLF